MYLKQNLKEVLPRALNEVCQTRPADPIEFLARYLYKAADSDLYFHEKAQYETEKRMLEIKLRREELQRQTAMLRYRKQISELKDFLDIWDGRGRSGVSSRRQSFRFQQSRRQSFRFQMQSRRASSAEKKKVEKVKKGEKVKRVEDVKKEARRRTRFSFFAGRGFSSSVISDSDSEYVLPESEISRDSSVKSSVEDRGKPRKKHYILRKGVLPLDEPRGVVSVQMDSRSSSRTQDEDALERNPSTLTSSSSRTASRRVSYGDEWGVQDSPTTPLQLDDTEVTSKQSSPGSPERRRSRIKSKHVGDEGKHIKFRTTSSARSKDKKSKWESSITDLSSSKVESESNKLKDVFEQMRGKIERIQKRRGSIQKTRARVRRDKHGTETSEDEQERDQSTVSEDVRLQREYEDELSEKMTMEERHRKRLEARTKKGVEKRHEVGKAFKEKTYFDRKKTPTSDKKSEDLKPSQDTTSKEDVDAEGSESESDEWESDEYPTARSSRDQSEALSGDEDTAQEGRRRVSKKRRQRSKAKINVSPATPDAEESFLSKDGSFIKDTDQKRKGKRQTKSSRRRHKGKNVEKQRVDFATKLLAMLLKIKRRSTVTSKRPSIKESPEEEAEYKQETDSPGRRRGTGHKISSRDTTSDANVKILERRLTKPKTVTALYDDDDDDDDVDEVKILAPPPSREMSYEDLVRNRAGMNKTAKKAKTLPYRRSFSKRRKSLSESDSKPLSGQFSELVFSNTVSATNIHDTESRSFETRMTTVITEEYSYPVTPVECQWLLTDSNTLVCRHPVLGDIRARPARNSNALDVSTWSDRTNYNWRSVYDHEIYVVADPFHEEHRINRKPKL